MPSGGFARPGSLMSGSTPRTSTSEIPGYMPAMTMGFRVASPKIQEAVAVGDAVRFTLRGILPNLAVTAIEKVK